MEKRKTIDLFGIDQSKGDQPKTVKPNLDVQPKTVKPNLDVQPKTVKPKTVKPQHKHQYNKNVQKYTYKKEKQGGTSTSDIASISTSTSKNYIPKIKYIFVPDNKFVPDYVIIEEEYISRKEYLPQEKKDILKRSSERKLKNGYRTASIFKENREWIISDIKNQILQRVPSSKKEDIPETIIYNFNYDNEFSSPTQAIEIIYGGGKNSKAIYDIPLFLIDYYNDILEKEIYKIQKLSQVLKKEYIEEHKKDAIEKKIVSLKEKIKSLQKSFENDIIKKIKARNLLLQTFYNYEFQYDNSSTDRKDKLIPNKIFQEKNGRKETYEIKKGEDVYLYFVEKVLSMEKYLASEDAVSRNEKIKKNIQREIKSHIDFENEKDRTLKFLVPKSKRVTHYEEDIEYDPENPSAGARLVETDKFGRTTYTYIYPDQNPKKEFQGELYYKTYKPMPGSEYIYDIEDTSSEESSEEKEESSKESIKTNFPLFFPGELFDTSVKDWDSKIGFWIKDVVYVYTTKKDKNNIIPGKRIYILPPYIKGVDEILKINNNCSKLRNYFNYGILPNTDNIISYLENIDPEYDLRINGESIYIPKVKFDFDMLYKYLNKIDGINLSLENVSQYDFSKPDDYYCTMPHTPSINDSQEYPKDFYKYFIASFANLKSENIKILNRGNLSSLHSSKNISLDDFFFQVEINFEDDKIIIEDEDIPNIPNNSSIKYLVIPLKIKSNIKRFVENKTLETIYENENVENYIFILLENFGDGGGYSVYIFDPRGFLKYDFLFDMEKVKKIYKKVVDAVLINVKNYFIDWSYFKFESNSFITFELSEINLKSVEYISSKFESEKRSLKWVLWFIDFLIHNTLKNVQFLYPSALIYISKFNKENIYITNYLNMYISNKSSIM